MKVGRYRKLAVEAKPYDPSAAEVASEAWQGFVAELSAQGRAARLRAASIDAWVAAERLPWAQAAYPEATVTPSLQVPERYRTSVDADAAVRELVRGQMEVRGPLRASRSSRPGPIARTAYVRHAPLPSAAVRTSPTRSRRTRWRW